MPNRDFVMEGYAFSSKAEYERAKKEQETIAYLNANTNMADMKAVYKVYQAAVEKKSFQTVFGIRYMEELRGKIVGSGLVEEDDLEPIPVAKVYAASSRKSSGESLDRKQAEKYKEAYEKAKSGRTVKNVVIAVLLLVIAAMFFVTYQSEYSVFTYFTDYKEQMRSELLDEYEGWSEELKQWEEELDRRQQQMEQ